MNDEQIEWFRAGGALNIIRASARASDDVERIQVGVSRCRGGAPLRARPTSAASCLWLDGMVSASSSAVGS